MKRSRIIQFIGNRNQMTLKLYTYIQMHHSRKKPNRHQRKNTAIKPKMRKKNYSLQIVVTMKEINKIFAELLMGIEVTHQQTFTHRTWPSTLVWTACAILTTTGLWNCFEVILLGRSSHFVWNGG